jgi:hypothetical protein
MLMPASLALLFAVVAAAPSSDSSAPVSFNKDIAPLVWKHCAGCHRPGEVGPFSLLDYHDAAKRADFLAAITADRRMPPWKAEPDFGHFHDERRLSAAEIALFRRWADAGAPEGNAADLPPRPQFTEGWQLGEPDLVLEMPQAFAVPADGRDIYQCFVIPIPVDGSRTVSAIEFRPGNRRVVHHAILYLDANGAARVRDEKEPGPGYRSFGGPGILPTGGLGGWAPGGMPRRLPDGVGKFLRRGSDLVLQLHYHPSGKPETDRSKVGIYFTKEPAKTIVGGLVIANGPKIPAGEKEYHLQARSEKLPVDVNVLGVAPHMHLLGRSMKAQAVLPDGKTVPLVWIKDWDFNWQMGYAFVEPVRLPKGSHIEIEAVYDNSAENPHNPNSPPKEVRWGEQTTDEMCLMSVQLTTDSLADLRQIVRLRGARLGGALAGGAELEDLAEESEPTAKETNDEPATSRLDQVVNEILDRGFPIAEPFREVLRPFDGDADNRIARAEFDTMPSAMRDKIRQVIRDRVQQAFQPAKK